MAKTKRSSPAPAVTPPAADTSLDRIAKVLSLLAIKGRDNAESITLLHQLGFPNGEIASMLSVSSGAVAQQLYVNRKSPKRKKKRTAD
jgi:hypothetical protein